MTAGTSTHVSEKGPLGPLVDIQASNVVGASPPLMVGAIDFGTTYSGWAYSFYHDFETDPTKGCVKQWHSGSGTLFTEKTPTVVLIKPDGKTLEAFGYEAENKYRDLADAEEHRDYYYFRKFKMMLHKQLSEKIDRDAILHDEMGKPLPAIDVFAMSIKYLVDDLHEVIRLRTTGSIEASDVHWVLTVPAIWTDSAKQFMREASEQAGIARSNLSIALEPEAASIYCRHLPVDKIVGPGNVSISSFPVGTRYMILDAGGGTVDITMHEVTDSGGVKEVKAASGGGWGGTLVDQAFEDLVNDFVGREVYQKFKREQTEDWLELTREFEIKKRTVHPAKEGRILVRFPVSLSRLSEQKNRQNLDEYINDSADYSGRVEFVNDKMKFSADVFKQLFENSNRKILKHVINLMKEEFVSASAILMVGGYSESPMLQLAVKETFPHMQIVVPNESSSAILRGALICGHRPDLISERVLKYTYGVACVRTFIEGKHPESKRVKTDQGDRCDGTFSKHVEIGQIVKVGETQVTQTYTPAYRNQKSMNVHIYASRRKDPYYIEDGCIKIGRLAINIAGGGLGCKVGVSFTFGGTEIEVEAKAEKTGQKTNAVINFLG